jgi:hypothetical protein
MKVQKQTGEIFEILSSGQFICSNSGETRVSKLYDYIDEPENYEQLYNYFFGIGFVLEKGDEYYYFSRKNESKVDFERKLDTACKWIDILDFLKTFDNAFVSGYSFTPHEIVVRMNVDAVLKSKAIEIRKIFKLEDKSSHDEIVRKIIEQLCKDGFAETENEILKSFKILSSFKYLEELVMDINIPEEVQNEIPE